MNKIPYCRRLYDVAHIETAFLSLVIQIRFSDTINDKKGTTKLSSCFILIYISFNTCAATTNFI